MPIRKVEFLWSVDGGPDGYTHVDHEKARLSDYLTLLLAGADAELEIKSSVGAIRPHFGSDSDRLNQAVMDAGVLGQQELVVARQKSKKLVPTHGLTITRQAGFLLKIGHGTP